jgi:HEAT repeat protein
MFRAPQLPRTLEAALRDVRSQKPDVRVEAVRDLVPHAEEARDRVVRALEGALRDEAARVRSAAALALADIGGHEVLASLLVAMEDEDAHVRQMAITALGEIGDVRATERLRRALADSRPEVRFQAVIAFPRVCKDPADAVKALLERTFDKDQLVCHIALRMAEELGGEGETAVPPALLDRARALLEHESSRVRVAAAIVLGRSGDPAGAKVLVDVARGEIRAEDPEDEAAAVELCGALRLEAARPGLERRAFGGPLSLRRDPFAWHARVALARMGHARATSEILKELGAWDRAKRTLAVAAAGRARIVAARDTIAAMRGDASRADQDAVDEALSALTAAPAEAR